MIINYNIQIHTCDIQTSLFTLHTYVYRHADMQDAYIPTLQYTHTYQVHCHDVFKT